MPLLTSPIDGSPMRQISRYGIEIDVCPTTGGIWLDKGELEKLMAFLKEEAANERRAPDHQDSKRGRANPRNRDGYDERSRYGDDRGEEGVFSRIMEIFEF